MSWLIWSLWTSFLYLLTSGPPGFAATATIGHPENLAQMRSLIRAFASR